MLFLRSYFLPNFSHIFRTVPPRLTLDFAPQANRLCHRIFQSMLSYLQIQLSTVHLQQLHLNIDDGGSSLPDMCLIQQCAYTASFTQCLPTILAVLNIISPISSQDILTSYDTYQAPPLLSPLPFYQPHISFRDYFDSVTTLHSHHADLSLTTFLQDHSLKPKLQRFLYGICYERSLQTFQHSLSLLNDPIRVAHYYTLIGKDSSRWQYLIPKFGLYTMSDKDYQSALARRFYLPHPQIPFGLTSLVVVCLDLPSLIKKAVISPLAALYGVSAKPRVIQSFKDCCIFCTMLAVVRLLKTATSFVRIMRLKVDVRTSPF